MYPKIINIVNQYYKKGLFIKVVSEILVPPNSEALLLVA